MSVFRVNQLMKRFNRPAFYRVSRGKLRGFRRLLLIKKLRREVRRRKRHTPYELMKWPWLNYSAEEY